MKDHEVFAEGNKKRITVYLKPLTNEVDDVPVIKFFSTPSRPWYVGYKDLKQIAGGKGIGIISTSEWLLPTHLAKKKKLWGQLIAEIY